MAWWPSGGQRGQRARVQGELKSGGGEPQAGVAGTARSLKGFLGLDTRRLGSLFRLVMTTSARPQRGEAAPGRRRAGGRRRGQRVGGTLKPHAYQPAHPPTRNGNEIRLGHKEGVVAVHHSHAAHPAVGHLQAPYGPAAACEQRRARAPAARKRSPASPSPPASKHGQRAWLRNTPLKPRSVRWAP